MRISFLRRRALVIVLLILFTLAVYLVPSNLANQLAAVAGSRADLLTVAFLDVGQGDAIYIETPDGIQMLIDGGADTSVLRELPKLMSFWDRTLDVVIATHPDKDHIGGLVDVLTRYEVERLVLVDNVSDTSVYEVFAQAVSSEEAEVAMAESGMEITLGEKVVFEILSPTGDPKNWESNTASIVGRLQYGAIGFMLTGDAPSSIEQYLVSYNPDQLESEVLKLGHHGSKTSTAEEFLQLVAPQYAVVSAGKDNRYGHPHPSVVALVEKFGVPLLSTAEAGTLIFKSDGERVWTNEE